MVSNSVNGIGIVLMRIIFFSRFKNFKIKKLKEDGDFFCYGLLEFFVKKMKFFICVYIINIMILFYFLY